MGRGSKWVLGGARIAWGRRNGWPSSWRNGAVGPNIRRYVRAVDRSASMRRFSTKNEKGFSSTSSAPASSA